MARIRQDMPFDDVQKEELEAAGPALFGRMWQTQMADLMGENTRYLSRCLEVPCNARLLPPHRTAIRKALEARLKEISKVLAMLDKHDDKIAKDWAA